MAIASVGENPRPQLDATSPEKSDSYKHCGGVGRTPFEYARQWLQSGKIHDLSLMSRVLNNQIVINIGRRRPKGQERDSKYATNDPGAVGSGVGGAVVKDVVEYGDDGGVVNGDECDVGGGVGGAARGAVGRVGAVVRLRAVGGAFGGVIGAASGSSQM